VTDQPLPLDIDGDYAEEQRAAIISDDGLYRYQLTRVWRRGAILPFIMLNPSTADGTEDDPTIRRCRGFARDMGYAGLTVLNLYAYRATKPRDLFLAMAKDVDVVGPENDECLAWLLESAADTKVPVIAAWGAHAAPLRVLELRTMPHATEVLRALGTTADGSPRHPLYLPASARPTRWPS
jgi:hypothetical protein